MNWGYRFARAVYRRLPLPSVVKEKLRASALALIHSWNPGSDPQERRAKLLSRIIPALQDGLEIGPLCSPIVTKAESSGRVQYVDYAAAEKLKEKYANDPNVRVGEIVDVDHVWGERSLPELVGAKRFDYVIASHVIEHIPDMLGWLKEVAEVLKDKGILSLAVPDKRYTFDYLRELTTPGILIDSYLLQRRRPGPREIFDHFALASSVDLEAAWTGSIDKRNLQRFGTLQQGFELAQNSLHTEQYHDVHISIFTPASFLDLLETASQLGLLDFAVVEFFDTARSTLEFFVSLERLPRDQDRQGGLAAQLATLAWARERLE